MVFSKMPLCSPCTAVAWWLKAEDVDFEATSNLKWVPKVKMVSFFGFKSEKNLDFASELIFFQRNTVSLV